MASFTICCFIHAQIFVSVAYGADVGVLAPTTPFCFDHKEVSPDGGTPSERTPLSSPDSARREGTPLSSEEEVYLHTSPLSSSLYSSPSPVHTRPEVTEAQVRAFFDAYQDYVQDGTNLDKRLRDPPSLPPTFLPSSVCAFFAQEKLRYVTTNDVGSVTGVFDKSYDTGDAWMVVVEGTLHIQKAPQSHLPLYLISDCSVDVAASFVGELCVRSLGSVTTRGTLSGPLTVIQAETGFCNAEEGNMHARALHITSPKAVNEGFIGSEASYRFNGRERALSVTTLCVHGTTFENQGEMRLLSGEMHALEGLKGQQEGLLTHSLEGAGEEDLSTHLHNFEKGRLFCEDTFQVDTLTNENADESAVHIQTLQTHTTRNYGLLATTRLFAKQCENHHVLHTKELTADVGINKGELTATDTHVGTLTNEGTYHTRDLTAGTVLTHGVLHTQGGHIGTLENTGAATLLGETIVKDHLTNTHLLRVSDLTAGHVTNRGISEAGHVTASLWENLGDKAETICEHRLHVTERLVNEGTVQTHDLTTPQAENHGKVVVTGKGDVTSLDNTRGKQGVSTRSGVRPSSGSGSSPDFYAADLVAKQVVNEGMFRTEAGIIDHLTNSGQGFLLGTTLVRKRIENRKGTLTAQRLTTDHVTNAGVLTLKDASLGYLENQRAGRVQATTLHTTQLTNAGTLKVYRSLTGHACVNTSTGTVQVGGHTDQPGTTELPRHSELEGTVSFTSCNAQDRMENHGQFLVNGDVSFLFGRRASKATYTAALGHQGSVQAQGETHHHLDTYGKFLNTGRIELHRGTLTLAAHHIHFDTRSTLATPRADFDMHTLDFHAKVTDVRNDWRIYMRGPARYTISTFANTRGEVFLGHTSGGWRTSGKWETQGKFVYDIDPTPGFGGQGVGGAQLGDGVVHIHRMETTLFRGDKGVVYNAPTNHLIHGHDAPAHMVSPETVQITAHSVHNKNGVIAGQKGLTITTRGGVIRNGNHVVAHNVLAHNQTLVNTFYQGNGACLRSTEGEVRLDAAGCPVVNRFGSIEGLHLHTLGSAFLNLSGRGQITRGAVIDCPLFENLYASCSSLLEEHVPGEPFPRMNGTVGHENMQKSRFGVAGHLTFTGGHLDTSGCELAIGEYRSTFTAPMNFQRVRLTAREIGMGYVQKTQQVRRCKSPPSHQFWKNDTIFYENVSYQADLTPIRPEIGVIQNMQLVVHNAVFEGRVTGPLIHMTTFEHFRTGCSGNVYIPPSKPAHVYRCVWDDLSPSQFFTETWEHGFRSVPLLGNVPYDLPSCLVISPEGIRKQTQHDYFYLHPLELVDTLMWTFMHQRGTPYVILGETPTDYIMRSYNSYQPIYEAIKDKYPQWILDGRPALKEPPVFGSEGMHADIHTACDSLYKFLKEEQAERCDPEERSLLTPLLLYVPALYKERTVLVPVSFIPPEYHNPRLLSHVPGIVAEDALTVTGVQGENYGILHGKNSLTILFKKFRYGCTFHHRSHTTHLHKGEQTETFMDRNPDGELSTERALRVAGPTEDDPLCALSECGGTATGKTGQFSLMNWTSRPAEAHSTVNRSVRKDTFSSAQTDLHPGVYAFPQGLKVYDGGSIDLESADLSSEKFIHLLAERALRLGAGAETYHSSSTTVSEEMLGGKSTERRSTSSLTHRRLRLKGPDLFLGVRQGDLNLVVPELTGNVAFYAPEGQTHFHAVEDRYTSQSEESEKSPFWISMSQSGVDSRTVRDITHSGGTCDISQVKSATAEFRQDHPYDALMKALEVHPHAEIRRLKDHFDQWEHDFETIGPGFAALITLVVSALTMGTGGIATSAGTKMAATLGLKSIASTAFVQGATAAMVSGMCSSLAVGAVAHQGNVGKALTQAFSAENLKHIGINMLAAGCFHSVCAKLDLPITGGDLTTHAARFGMSVATEGFVHTALEPGDPEETLKQAVQTSAIREVASFAASKIGELSHHAKINRWTQRLMHGAVGAGAAKLLGQDPSAGAIGAVIGEMVGESYRAAHPEVSTDTNDPSFDRDAYDALVHKGVHLAKFVAATAVMMAGKDPSAAMEAAGRAVRENSCMLVGMVDTPELQQMMEEIQRKKEQKAQECAECEQLQALVGCDPEKDKMTPAWWEKDSGLNKVFDAINVYVEPVAYAGFMMAGTYGGMATMTANPVVGGLLGMCLGAATCHEVAKTFEQCAGPLIETTHKYLVANYGEKAGGCFILSLKAFATAGIIKMGHVTYATTKATVRDAVTHAQAIEFNALRETTLVDRRAGTGQALGNSTEARSAIATKTGPPFLDSRKYRVLSAKYMQEMEQRSGIPITKTQRDLLQEAIQKEQFEKLTVDAKTQHTNLFNKTTKNRLISEWESRTGNVWPKSRVKDKETGLYKDKNDQVHHIIPQEYGGPHEWWNVHPLHSAQHQAGVHGSGSYLRQLKKSYENQ